MSLAYEKYLQLQRLRNAAPITLEPHRTALLIIDMQDYFLNLESPLSRACDAQVPGVLHYFQEHGRSIAEPTLQRLLGVFRTHGMRVVYHHPVHGSRNRFLPERAKPGRGCVQGRR